MYKKIISQIDASLTYIVINFLNLLGRTFFAGKIRANILRLLGFNIGKNVSIRHNPMIHQKSDKLFIGEGCSINNNVYFDAGGSIIIGKYCNVGFNTVFTTSRHEIKSDFKRLRPCITPSNIIIKDFVWICANSTIMGGVTIGEGSVVAAGSVVTKNVPPNTIVAGVPAKVIRNLE